MSVPSVIFNKVNSNLGSVGPDATGRLAIIAPGSAGSLNAPAAFARQDLALAAVGYGPLVEDASYDMNVAGKPVVLIRPATSTAATYTSVTFTGTGSSVVTAGGSSPVDDYDVIVTVVVGGTRGTPGITYTYSLDGGSNTSGVQALGSSTTLTIPNSGVSFSLAAGTLVASDSWTCSTAHARMTDADLPAALESLRVTALPWEAVLIDSEIGTGTVSIVDTWLAGLETVGKFRMAFMAVRRKTAPVPAGETEAAYLTAMTTIMASTTSIRVSVSADAGALASLVNGLLLPRSTALALAARSMLIPIGEDPAAVARGPVPGFILPSGTGAPKWHDEMLYPGLDDIRLTTLRSFPGAQGTFINNARVASSNGSDYVFTQHIRVMNRACEIAFQVLSTQLSIGVGKKAPDPITGQVYILEQSAQKIEALVNAQLTNALKGQCVGAAFVMSRTDDLSANTGATVHGEVQVDPLAYIKTFAVNAVFVKQIGVTTT